MVFLTSSRVTWSMSLHTLSNAPLRKSYHSGRPETQHINHARWQVINGALYPSEALITSALLLGTLIPIFGATSASSLHSQSFILFLPSSHPSFCPLLVMVVELQSSPLPERQNVP